MSNNVTTGFGSESFIKRWQLFTLAEQLGNVGSEVDRVIAWRNKNQPTVSLNAFYRVLDLLDLTIGDPRWGGPKRRELARLRETLCDTFVGDNFYNTPPEFFSRYFYHFALLANRMKEGKLSAAGAK